MHRLGYGFSALVLVLGLSGCGGGGIQEGMPADATGQLTPEQEQLQKDLMAEEEAAAKARKTQKGP
jgi:hypothetical protein